MRVDFSPEGNSAERRDDRLGKVFSAAFDSVCESCGFDIIAGDEVRYFDGDVMHRGCAEVEAK